MAKGWSDKRPMSPHMSVWKWHAAMRASILHRAAAVTVYIALLVICVWLAIFAVGEAGFEAVKALVYSPLGAISFFVFSLALVYNSLIDVRHLFWDTGKGMGQKAANLSSTLLLVLAIAIAVVLTGCLVCSLGGGSS
ncbi:MAG: succinate dehydrogenase, cytochrome b556 subunit [Robiginitomaculum sp.]|nr:MAG: succinate dehydrogenase, cytochrome b556 subunit [Robiginitomaculum sp.]